MAHDDRIVDDHRIPVELIETDEATVQMIRTDIPGQRYRLAVQRKTTVRNAIADTSDGRSEIRIRFAQVACLSASIRIDCIIMCRRNASPYSPFISSKPSATSAQRPWASGTTIDVIVAPYVMTFTLNKTIVKRTPYCT